MKEKHIAGWISAAMVIIVGIISFPYAWFYVQAKDFHSHDFDINGNVQIEIHSYQKDIRDELSTQRDKNVVLSAIKREAEYKGPLFYRLPMQLKGEHEIYEVKIADLTGGGHWILYIADDEEYNYLYCGDNFNAGLAVSRELLDILDEYTAE